MDLLFDFYLKSLSLVLLDNPTINTFLAYYNENPVATSIGIYGSGVIGLYGVTTLKEARGNRIGTAITLAPLYEAKNAGYEIGVLHSSEMGLNLYKRIGFKEYIQIERFVWNF
ncbi:MAG: GNAT family N-acetyltransferase [Promethearchaeota archaeon]